MPQRLTLIPTAVRSRTECAGRMMRAARAIFLLATTAILVSCEAGLDPAKDLTGT